MARYRIKIAKEDGYYAWFVIQKRWLFWWFDFYPEDPTRDVRHLEHMIIKFEA